MRTKKKTGCGDENVTTHPRNHAFPDKILAVPINGTGTGKGKFEDRPVDRLVQMCLW